MVQKITLFEPHFDGATFGPGTSSSESTDEDPTLEETVVSDDDVSESGGRGRKILGLIVASVVVSVVVSTIARRLAGDDEFEAIELEDDGDEPVDEEPIDVVEE